MFGSNDEQKNACTVRVVGNAFSGWERQGTKKKSFVTHSKTLTLHFKSVPSNVEEKKKRNPRKKAERSAASQRKKMCLWI